MGVAVAGCGGGRAPVASGSPATGPAVTTTTDPASATTDPASATTVPGHSTSPTTGSGEPVLIVGSSDGTVGYDGREPSTIGFSRDSTNVVSHLSWTSWDPAAAVGQGLLGINDCKPSCAAGTVTQVLVTVHLTKVVDGHFTAMTEKAGSLFHSYSYPADWAASAS